MPRVPTLGGPSVRQQNIPSVRVPTQGQPVETFGGGAVAGNVARATQGFVQTADQIVQEEKQKADYYVQTENKRLLDEWDLANRFDSKRSY